MPWAPLNSSQVQFTLSSLVIFLPSPPLPVTPPSVQPVSPPMVVSTSLAADLEGLTLTDTSLVPSVSWGGTWLRSGLYAVVWFCVEGAGL